MVRKQSASPHYIPDPSGPEAVRRPANAREAFCSDDNMARQWSSRETQRNGAPTQGGSTGARRRGSGRRQRRRGSRRASLLQQDSEPEDELSQRPLANRLAAAKKAFVGPNAKAPANSVVVESDMVPVADAVPSCTVSLDTFSDDQKEVREMMAAIMCVCAHFVCCDIL